MKSLNIASSAAATSRLLSGLQLFIIFLFIMVVIQATPVRAVETLFDITQKKSWSGDYDGMVERRLIRILVVNDKMQTFVDHGKLRGITADMATEFEKYVNEREKKGTLAIEVVIFPVSRDRLIPLLNEGYGDIASGNLTITEERQKIVDFADPFMSQIKELLVTTKDAKVESISDISGKALYLQKLSSYYEHALELNKRLEKEGKKGLKIIEVSPLLDTSDLLEMINADLIPMTVVDSHKAEFWEQIFENVKVHDGIAFNEGGQIAWALRKNSPQLTEVVNGFVKNHKKGTLMGNILFKKYLKDSTWAKKALDPDEVKKFKDTASLFKKYAVQYQFDFLMTVALAYQESQLDHSKKSDAGAVGIMQLLPSTAADENVGIPNIEVLENNIHAGHKYLRFIQDRYFDEPEIDTLNRYLFTFAAYNAGPARVAELRKEAADEGYDPNVWFHNVEIIAAERVGRETVQYVSNIFKYYVSYSLADIAEEQKESVVEEK